jgi:hypothetical protein
MLYPALFRSRRRARCERHLGGEVFVRIGLDIWAGGLSGVRLLGSPTSLGRRVGSAAKTLGTSVWPPCKTSVNALTRAPETHWSRE